MPSKKYSRKMRKSGKKSMRKRGGQTTPDRRTTARNATPRRSRRRSTHITTTHIQPTSLLQHFERADRHHIRRNRDNDSEGHTTSEEMSD
jgi:hypothetical protein